MIGCSIANRYFLFIISWLFISLRNECLAIKEELSQGRFWFVVKNRRMWSFGIATIYPFVVIVKPQKRIIIIILCHLWNICLIFSPHLFHRIRLFKFGVPFYWIQQISICLFGRVTRFPFGAGGMALLSLACFILRRRFTVLCRKWKRAGRVNYCSFVALLRFWAGVFCFRTRNTEAQKTSERVSQCRYSNSWSPPKELIGAVLFEERKHDFIQNKVKCPTCSVLL